MPTRTLPSLRNTAAAGQTLELCIGAVDRPWLQKKEKAMINEMGPFEFSLATEVDCFWQDRIMATGPENGMKPDGWKKTESFATENQDRTLSRI